MATGNGTSTVVKPSSIHIDVNQFQKEPHHCKFENCQNHRRGYNDFCREHKAIGKVISGRIARKKAIDKIAARDKSNYAVDVEPSVLVPEETTPGNGSALLEIIQVLLAPVILFITFYTFFIIPISELMDCIMGC
tara:strand:- start:812 stop:1216 length:405 start_codon:yes stop_codon:yes gene_type:complete